ncbi:MAG: hypothetical protein EOR60_03660 [Mesorhizobium sp.]|nr:MAG: hypothetical protein EOR60_03660 [Mesorhizobium sp.]
MEELNEALQRNPNFAFVHIILGVAYGYAGLAEDGLRQLEIARRLSPLDQTQAANLSVEGLCHLVAGRYAEAVRAERRAVLMRPNFGTAWRTLTAAAGLAGALETARQGLVECKRLQPNQRDQTQMGSRRDELLSSPCEREGASRAKAACRPESLVSWGYLSSDDLDMLTEAFTAHCLAYGIHAGKERDDVARLVVCFS